MTEYEKELKERVAKLGDKFIFQGNIYTASSTEEIGNCLGCGFHNTSEHYCHLVPSCDRYDVIYIKEVNCA